MDLHLDCYLIRVMEIIELEYEIRMFNCMRKAYMCVRNEPQMNRECIERNSCQVARAVEIIRTPK